MRILRLLLVLSVAVGASFVSPKAEAVSCKVILCGQSGCVTFCCLLRGMSEGGGCEYDDCSWYDRCI